MDLDPAPAPLPERIQLIGSSIRLNPLDPERHGEALWKGLSGEVNDPLWLYLPEGPFRERSAFDAYLARKAKSNEAFCYAIVEKHSGGALGLASLMRIDRPNRVIEVGGIHYSRALQRTTGATEAMYLLARYVFEDLRYRRYEWKCNALNEPSRRAAQRLGFTFEGVFRQHMIVKGNNRDTAWYSMLDAEWPDRKKKFEAWLRPENFREDGTQRKRLEDEQKMNGAATRERRPPHKGVYSVWRQRNEPDDWFVHACRIRRGLLLGSGRRDTRPKL